LGIEPGRTTQDLEGAILRQDPQLDFSPLSPVDAASPDTGTWLPPGRKPVTVVFVDLAPVRPHEGRDPENRQHLVHRGYDLAVAALTRHGGVVQGLIGDVVVAVFGIPAAREDDALRAARAALEIRRDLAALNEELRRGGAGLMARIGVDTGEVIVGGSPLDRPSASGDAVNMAARLQQSAAQGDVLLGEGTLRLVESSVVVETASLDERAWRLVDVLSNPAVTVSTTSMFGRSRELDRLRAIFEDTIRNRQPTVVTVLGEAGIGKTRLVGEFATSVEPSARVLTGHCPPYGDGITFWPVREIILQAVGDGGPAAISELMAGEMDGESIAFQVTAVAGLGPEPEAGSNPFPALRRFLERLAEAGPLVVVVEDVHWAQPTLLDLIDYFAGSAAAPILLLCPARPEYLDQPRHRELGDEHGTTLVLEPLGRDDSQKLIVARRGERGISEETLDLLVETAQGNPLFLGQMLAALEEEREVALPGSIQALLAARLDRLGPAQRDLIRSASVAGVGFSTETLEALVPTQVRPLLGRHLRALEEKALILPSDGSSRSFTFHHVLIQQAAYRSIPREVRAELHERLAEWLELDTRRGHPEPEEVVGYHLEQAYENRRRLGLDDEHTRGLAVEAGQRLANAGFRAYLRYDGAATANLLGRAQALLPDDHPQRPEVLRQLAEVYQVLGRHDRAAEVLDERLGFEADPLIQQAIRLERAKVNIHLGPDSHSLTSMRAEAERALEVFEAEGDQAGRARAYLVLVFLHELEGDMAAMEHAAQRGLVHADLSGEPREELAMRWMLAWAVMRGSAPVPACIELCEELVRWRGRQHPGVLSELGVLWAMRGDIDEGRRLIARARELAAMELRVRRPLMFIAVSSGTVETMSGDGAAAERELRLGLDLATDFGERDVIAQATAGLALNLVARGRLDEANDFVRQSRVAAPTESVISQVLWRIATAVVGANDQTEAEQLARQAVELVPDDMLNLAADIRLDLARVLVAGGQQAAAGIQIEEAVALYTRKGNLTGAALARRVHAVPAAVTRDG
ncbi:MAG TPA: AAA family ATPase, partial [Acidimicrobiia bacterium]|nr:AAA family ATPase [Acidimicrobiia bacterium]